ncbi:MAG: DUF4124 domain-containing protein [Methylobacter sp.]|jgi:hypothetical protein
MKTAIFLLLAVITSSVNAEIFKCESAAGKIEYQSTPCPPTAHQHVIEIKKEDPRRLEEAQTRFKAWQAEQEKLKEKELKEAKERQEELDRQEAINALKRSAIAQEKAAAAAAAAAQQPVIIDRFYIPLYRHHGPDSSGHHNAPHVHDQRNPNDIPARPNAIDANRQPSPHDRPTFGR